MRIALLPAVVLLAGLCACGVDRWPENYIYTGRSLWIDSIMREDYLWWEEIPAFEELNYFLEPAEFLNAAKSSQDNYSTVDTFCATPLPTYGFDYTLSSIPSNDTAYYAQITYIIPGSPADEAGLKRGEWIMQVDGDYITSKRENVLTEGGGRALQVGTCRVFPATGESEADSTAIVFDRNVTLPAPASVEDAIVPFDTILDNHIGYIVYNSFSPEHDAEVLAFSQHCRNSGVDNVVIDLRYNEGGDMESAQLWGTILMPSTSQGNVFASLYYSEKQSSRNRELTFDMALLEGEGANLDLSTVYILTSDLTCGAAEMLVNGLRPYMRVVLVGGKTRGNYYGTAGYHNGTLGCQVNLVVCEALNAEGTADFADGFTPDLYVDGLGNPATVLPLGNPQEALLSAALGLINGTIELPSEEPGQSVARNVRVRRHFPKGLSVGR